MDTTIKENASEIVRKIHDLGCWEYQMEVIFHPEDKDKAMDILRDLPVPEGTTIRLFQSSVAQRDHIFFVPPTWRRDVYDLDLEEIEFTEDAPVDASDADVVGE